MSQVDHYLVAVGALALVLVLLSGRVRHLPLSEPLVALALGVALGPEVAGWLELPGGRPHTLLLEVTRLTLAFALIAIALRYGASDLRRLLRPLGVLLTVVLAGMTLVVAGLACGLLGLPAELALLLGATLAPTDPVLSSSVVIGEPAERDLPDRLRQAISGEAGANDGLAFPFVLLGIALVHGRGLGGWALESVWGVAVAVTVGAGLGLLAGHLLRRARERRSVEPSAFLVFTLMLALFALGIGRLLRADGVLAVFVAGLAFNVVVTGEERGSENRIDEAINRLLVLPVFVLLGVALPWGAWSDLGWRLLPFGVAVLLLRRLPVVLALRRVIGLNLPDAAFLGWFGPVGVAALFYLAHAVHTGTATTEVWAAGTFAIALSTVAHGISTLPGRLWYVAATRQGRQQPTP